MPGTNNTSITSGNISKSTVKSGSIVNSSKNADNDTSLKVGDIVESEVESGEIVESNVDLEEIISYVERIVKKTVHDGMTPEDAIDVIFTEVGQQPSTQARLKNALKAGASEALKAAFDHPAVHIPFEMVKAYSETK